MKHKYTYPELNAYKKGYSKAYRVGTSHGKTLAIDICMILGRRLGQPKGYYKALGEIIEELEK